MEASTVHVVHCIDTEGPFVEPLDQTFMRLKNLYHVDLPISKETLINLSQGNFELEEFHQEVMRLAKSSLLNLENWDQISSELDFLCSAESRNKVLDSFGGGWVFNWFVMDHIGYHVNPRGRDIGYHNIFNKYRELTSKSSNAKDGLHFHYHPFPFSGQANHSATHYFAHNDTLYQILSRRLIDYLWFPNCYRPGFHVTRPDSHWFLEQFIPFEFSNQSYETNDRDRLDEDTARFEDWRRAPRTWEPYHPHHDDYQKVGNCRRWIGRCLNVGARYRLLLQDDVNQAFEEASKGMPVIMSFANHDYRIMRDDIAHVQSCLKVASEKYPHVPFKFCEAREAFQAVLPLGDRDSGAFEMQLDGKVLKIRCSCSIFGPQPYFALKTKGGTYYHDNLDIERPFREWSYTFDEHSVCIDLLEAVAIAASDKAGRTMLGKISFTPEEVKVEYKCL